MKKVLWLIAVFMVALGSLCYAKVTVPDTIRIGIYSSGTSVSSFTISSESGMQVGTADNKGNFTLVKEIESGKKLTVKKGSKAQSVNVEGLGDLGDASHFVTFIPNSTKGTPLLKVNDNRYRGSIEVRRYSSSDMTVINELSMQEYLYGVVPREIGGTSPIEAVKAQAIIARTYAAKNYTRRQDLGFNLTNTVSDQAYGGYDWEYSNSNNAVDETEGMVAVYQGELIGGYYFSTSGGYTESSVNVWGGDFDYLEAVPDPYEPSDLAKTTWSVTYSASDIEKKLADKGVYIGSVQNMIVTEVSDAGRALSLDIIGTNGIQTYTKANIRSFLGLDSQWFTINSEAPQVPSVNTNPKPSAKDEAMIEDEEEGDSVETNSTETVVDDIEIITKKKFVTDEKDDVIVTDEKDDVMVEVEEGDQIVIPEKKPLIARMIEKIISIRDDQETLLAKAFNHQTNTSEKTISQKVQYGAKNTTSGVTSTFQIQGRGWGHSVGMSQNGAIGMARNDFSAEEIIKWYYSGVEITK